MSTFNLSAPYNPTGDQPESIEALTSGLVKGMRFQTLEGVTGSGKTFAIANVIARHGKPTLVVSHNKTLAAQLYSEFKSFFPHNAVEYFISYYDYYQPEAYIPQTDTYIEKDSSINEEIERLRLSATHSLLNREDVIIVASVSCIFGLGSPEDYREMVVHLQKGEQADRDHVLHKLVDIQYSRNDFEQTPGTFRVRGDTLEIYPSYTREAIRIDFFGDQVERIRRIDPLTGDTQADITWATVSPAKHFVMPLRKIEQAIGSIEEELEQQVASFEKQQKLLEAQRLKMRTKYDLEMLREVGYCAGIENYSRHLSGRKAGERPATLSDYFSSDYLMIIDESHVTIPQLRGMYNGDRSRKQVLVEHGFRLPSALDNRPLNFDEFLEVTDPTIFTTATPGPFELDVGGKPIEQVIRPTGIIEPAIDIRPLKHQIDDLMEEIRIRAERNERVLVTTLTKRIAEDLSEYLQNVGLKVKYLHSEIGALERVDILCGLRRAEFDCLIGINLLREGLDLPEVSLVAILDADKEGFLRSETSLIQTAGRAARHISGQVFLYADHVTDSMKRMIDKVEGRRKKQVAYNKKYKITPQRIEKSVQESLSSTPDAEEIEKKVVCETGEDYNVHTVLTELDHEMMEAAKALEFERASILRDQIYELKASTDSKKEKKQRKVNVKYSVRRRKRR